MGKLFTTENRIVRKICDEFGVFFLTDDGDSAAECSFVFRAAALKSALSLFHKCIRDKTGIITNGCDRDDDICWSIM